MAEPLEKKRRILETRSDDSPDPDLFPPIPNNRRNSHRRLPPELFTKIAEMLTPANRARMRRVDKEMKEAVDPLFEYKHLVTECKNLITDGRNCFTQRRVGSLPHSFRVLCPQQCEPFKIKYLTVILTIFKHMLEYTNLYRLLHNGMLLNFAFVEGEASFQIFLEDNRVVTPVTSSNNWVLRDFTQPNTIISKQTLVGLLSTQSRLTLRLTIQTDAKLSTGISRLSFVEMKEGKLSRIAPLFENVHAVAEIGRENTYHCYLMQRIQGPEVTKPIDPTISKYRFEDDDLWFGLP